MSSKAENSLERCLAVVAIELAQASEFSVGFEEGAGAEGVVAL